MYYTRYAALFGLLSVLSACSDDYVDPWGQPAGLTQSLRQLQFDHADLTEDEIIERDDLTRQVLGDVDLFITGSLAPFGSDAGDIAVRLDRLMGLRAGDAAHNVAFFATVGDDPYLIVGIEVPRRTGAIQEDAVAFHAYKIMNQHYMLVASSDELASSDGDVPFLSGLNAKMFDERPEPGAVWMLAWADVPPQSPTTVAMRLYSFDGLAFRTVWSPLDYVTPKTEPYVDFQADGFSLSVLPDPHGSLMEIDTYRLTSQGPLKVSVETMRFAPEAAALPDPGDGE